MNETLHPKPANQSSIGLIFFASAPFEEVIKQFQMKSYPAKLMSGERVEV
jgi:hypothetical protein